MNYGKLAVKPYIVYYAAIRESFDLDNHIYYQEEAKSYFFCVEGKAGSIMVG